MPFKSYLIEKFQTTHENKYFREFTALLGNKFNNSEGEHVLIGNISCNGHQMDAVFIARGQITVIDFKDYSGDLTFSENNPWRMNSPTRARSALYIVGNLDYCKNLRNGINASPLSKLARYAEGLDKVRHF